MMVLLRLLRVQVDIPPPFSLMPQPLLKAGGDAAVTGVLMVLMVSAVQAATAQQLPAREHALTACLAAEYPLSFAVTFSPS